MNVRKKWKYRKNNFLFLNLSLSLQFILNENEINQLTVFLVNNVLLIILQYAL